MSAWVVTMGAGATMGSCIRRLPFHPKERLGPQSITWASEMAKHNSGVAELAHHIIEEMGPRFAASKTVVEGRLKLPQCLHKSFDITGDNLKCGQRKSFTGSPTDW